MRACYLPLLLASACDQMPDMGTLAEDLAVTAYEAAFPEAKAKPAPVQVIAVPRMEFSQACSALIHAPEIKGSDGMNCLEMPKSTKGITSCPQLEGERATIQGADSTRSWACYKPS